MHVDFSTLDPFTRYIVLGAGAIILLGLLLSIIGRWRQRRRTSEIQASVRKSVAERERRAAERTQLADRILATSSTGQLLGFEIVRQIETVFSDGEPASSESVAAIKSAAAHKGANALINVQVRQSPGGKWIASGDAIVVRPTTPPPPPAPPSSSGDEPANTDQIY